MHNIDIIITLAINDIRCYRTEFSGGLIIKDDITQSVQRVPEHMVFESILGT